MQNQWKCITKIRYIYDTIYKSIYKLMARGKNYVITTQLIKKTFKYILLMCTY